MDPRFTQDMLEQANRYQECFGYGEAKSVTFVENLPKHLKFGEFDTVPARKTSRTTMSIVDEAGRAARVSEYSQKMLSKIPRPCSNRSGNAEGTGC